MEKMLRRLETFSARGSDGKVYVVHGYEHLARVDAFVDVQGHWEPTGASEYKLADGRPVRMERDGVMAVRGTNVRLEPERRQ